MLLFWINVVLATVRKLNWVPFDLSQCDLFYFIFFLISSLEWERRSCQTVKTLTICIRWIAILFGRFFQCLMYLFQRQPDDRCDQCLWTFSADKKKKRNSITSAALEFFFSQMRHKFMSIDFHVRNEMNKNEESVAGCRCDHKYAIEIARHYR